MTFVHTWNKECEESLKLGLVAIQQADLINNLKITIASVNGVVSMQQSEISRLESKIKVVEDSNIWFSKWGTMKDSEPRMKELSDKLQKALERANMIQEDKASTIIATNERMETTIKDLKMNERLARLALEEYKKEGELSYNNL